MKGYELARKLGISSSEVVEQYNLKSHMSVVPDHIVKEAIGDEKKIMEEQAPTETANTAETTVVDCKHTDAEIELSIRCLGNKSPLWKWRERIA